MPFRKLMLRLMLWSLAIAAVVGALAILFGGQDQLGRVSGTTLVTAVAAALMMLASLLVDRPATRVAGLLGMTVIVFEFLFGQMLIWELTALLSVHRPEETAGMTMGFTALCTGPAMFFLGTCSLPRMRVASRAGVALTAAAFTALVIGLWIPATWPQWQTKWFETSGVIASVGWAIVANLVAGGVGPTSRLTWRQIMCFIGAASGTIAAAIAIFAVWKELHENSGVFTTFVCIAVAAAHANLCMLAPLVGVQRWVRAATILAAVITAALVDLIVIEPAWLKSSDLATRFAGAFGVAASCGSLALLVLTLINRKLLAPPRPFEDIASITLQCPGCNRKQVLAVGRSACPDCRLQFDIRVNEPRCPNCDYLLLHLTSDRCPECGTPVSVSAPMSPVPRPAEA